MSPANEHYLKETIGFIVFIGLTFIALSYPARRFGRKLASYRTIHRSLKLQIENCSTLTEAGVLDQAIDNFFYDFKMVDPVAVKTMAEELDQSLTDRKKALRQAVETI